MSSGATDGSWRTDRRAGRRRLPPPGVPRPQSPDAPRINPSDGIAYTYDEIQQFYGPRMTEAQLNRWWNSLTQKIPKHRRRRPSRDPHPTKQYTLDRWAAEYPDELRVSPLGIPMTRQAYRAQHRDIGTRTVVSITRAWTELTPCVSRTPAGSVDHPTPTHRADMPAQASGVRSEFRDQLFQEIRRIHRNVSDPRASSAPPRPPTEPTMQPLIEEVRRRLMADAKEQITEAIHGATARAESEHRIHLARVTSTDGRQIVQNIMSQLVEIHDYALRGAMEQAAAGADPPAFRTFQDVVGWISRTGTRVDDIYNRMGVTETIAQSARWTAEHVADEIEHHRNRLDHGASQRVTIEWIVWNLTKNNYSLIAYLPEEILLAVLRLETNRAMTITGSGWRRQSRLAYTNRGTFLNTIPRPVELRAPVASGHPTDEYQGYASIEWPMRDPRAGRNGTARGMTPGIRVRPPLRLRTGDHWMITMHAERTMQDPQREAIDIFSRFPTVQNINPRTSLNEICSYPVSPFHGWSRLEKQQWIRNQTAAVAAEPITHFLARSRLKSRIDAYAERSRQAIVQASALVNFDNYDDDDPDLELEVIAALAALRAVPEPDLDPTAEQAWPEPTEVIMREIEDAAIEFTVHDRDRQRQGDHAVDVDYDIEYRHYNLGRWDGAPYFVKGHEDPGSTVRSYCREIGRFTVPPIAQEDIAYTCFQTIDLIIPHPWDTSDPTDQIRHPNGWDRSLIPPGERDLPWPPIALASHRTGRMVLAVPQGSPTWWIFTGDHRQRADTDLQRTPYGAIILAVFWTHQCEPTAEHVGIGRLVDRDDVPTEPRGESRIIRRQIIYTYAEGWSSDAFGRMLGSLLATPDSTRDPTDDPGPYLHFRRSELHRLAANDDSEGGNPIAIIYGFRPHRPIGLDGRSAFGQMMSRSGGMAKIQDAAIALMTISQQVIRNTEALLKVGYWAEEIHYRQRNLDLGWIHEQERRRGNQSYEADPAEVDADRRARGTENRVNQVAINYASNLMHFIDGRSDQEILRQTAPYGRAQRDGSGPQIQWVSWTGIMAPDPGRVDPSDAAPLRLLGYPMTTNLGPSEQDYTSDRELVGLIERGDCPEIRFTTDPANVIAANRSERLSGDFARNEGLTVSVGAIRRGIEDLRQGDGRTHDPATIALNRLLEDGATITAQISAILEARGTRSEAIDTIQRIFREDP